MQNKQSSFAEAEAAFALQLRELQVDVLNFRTTTLQKFEAVRRRARV